MKSFKIYSVTTNFNNFKSIPTWLSIFFNRVNDNIIKLAGKELNLQKESGGTEKNFVLNDHSVMESAHKRDRVFIGDINRYRCYYMNDVNRCMISSQIQTCHSNWYS